MRKTCSSSRDAIVIFSNITLFATPTFAVICRLSLFLSAAAADPRTHVTEIHRRVRLLPLRGDAAYALAPFYAHMKCYSGAGVARSTAIFYGASYAYTVESAAFDVYVKRTENIALRASTYAERLFVA